MFKSGRRPLVDFNPLNRATLASIDKIGTRSLVQKDKGGGNGGGLSDMAKRSAKRRLSSGGKVRVVKGRVRVRVAGYNTLQSISPVNLIRYIPAIKIRVAAKRYLNLKNSGGGGKQKGRRRKNQKKRRGGRR